MGNGVQEAALLLTGPFCGAFLIFSWSRSGRRAWLFGALGLLAFDAYALLIA
jgi:drug/metabolite transporter superfamily protein YnfA